MAIEHNEGILTKTRKPTDIKSYVGDSPEFMYKTKEDIPIQYRYPGMIVHEYLNKTWKDYKWNEITKEWNLISNTIMILNHFAYIQPKNTIEDFARIEIPKQYNINNAIVTVNGILLTQDSSSIYKIYKSKNKTILELEFPLETNDIVAVIKY